MYEPKSHGDTHRFTNGFQPLRHTSDYHQLVNRRPEFTDVRSKSLGELEMTLALASSEFEELQRRENELPQSWNALPIPQKHQYKRLRENFFDTARNVLYSSLPLGRDTLEVGATALGYSPVAVLAPPLRVLLYIWDALLLVESNASDCLALTARCVDILVIIDNEIREAGADLAIDLKAPLEALTNAFKDVRETLLRETKRSFLKRYLRRREAREEIGGCDSTLKFALDMFGLKIQIRSLRQLLETEKQLMDGEQDRTERKKWERINQHLVKKGLDKIWRKLSSTSSKSELFSQRDTSSTFSFSRENLSRTDFDTGDDHPEDHPGDTGLRRAMSIGDPSPPPSPEAGPSRGRSTPTPLIPHSAPRDSAESWHTPPSPTGTRSTNDSESASGGDTNDEEEEEEEEDPRTPTASSDILRDRLATSLAQRLLSRQLSDSISTDEANPENARELMRQAIDGASEFLDDLQSVLETSVGDDDARSVASETPSEAGSDRTVRYEDAKECMDMDEFEDADDGYETERCEDVDECDETASRFEDADEFFEGASQFEDADEFLERDQFKVAVDKLETASPYEDVDKCDETASQFEDADEFLETASQFEDADESLERDQFEDADESLERDQFKVAVDNLETASQYEDADERLWTASQFEDADESFDTSQFKATSGPAEVQSIFEDAPESFYNSLDELDESAELEEAAPVDAPGSSFQSKSSFPSLEERTYVKKIITALQRSYTA